MTRKNTPVRIALLGSYPPPYGGVTIHLQRLKGRLEENEYECAVYDLINKRGTRPGNGEWEKITSLPVWVVKYFLFAREDIIHCHYTDWRVRAIAGLMGLRGKKTIISIHGSNLEDSVRNGNWLKRQIIRFTLKHCSFIITANHKIEEFVLSLGIKPDRVKTIPPFIAPDIKKEDIDKIPQEVWDFIDKHQPAILANAFRITFYDGQDLYGLDMCVELCASLKIDYPEIGFIFCLPEIGDEEYFLKIKQQIQEKGIEDNFLFVTQSNQVYPIIMKTGLFVRPTNTDGDAISLREALCFKIPSVASDVVPRPEGTVLFRTRDIDDLILKVKDVLGNYEQHKKRLEETGVEDGFIKIMDIYQRLAGNG